VAMGGESELARNAIRLSLGWRTRAEEIEYVLDVFPNVVQRVRELAGN
jgi:cysteine sulfinate desulfinase/cysteine desulfurase-like protein